MRPRFRDDADEDGQQYHPRYSIADKCFNIKVVQTNLDDEQCTESPKENAQEVLADDMLPEMFFDEVFRCRGDEPHHEQTHNGKNEIHPILVEDIQLSMSGFLMFMLQHTEGQGHNEQDYT